MNTREGIGFLLRIIKEIQNSFENPVILFTQKDYGDGIFLALKDIREALLEKAAPNKIATIVNSFHIRWLEAIHDVEKFKKRIKETPRDVILNAVDFTTESASKRYKQLRKYVDDEKINMTEDEYNKLSLEVRVVHEMKEIVISTVLEKKKYIQTQADQTEYHLKIQDEIEELMYWLDKQYDSLAIVFCKLLNLKIPIVPSDLTKTLQQVIDEVAAVPTPEAQKTAELINVKGKMIGSMIRISSLNDLEISKVIAKIQDLEDRISRLQNQNSSAVMALKHKVMYLEDRLQSLENIKMSVKRLKALPTSSSAQVLADDRDVNIFKHLLPRHDRCRLVEQLLQLWNSAILEHDHDSIISILSFAELKEMFSDEKGNFTVDKFGRKIYSKTDDENLYQLNENNELVPLKDDDRHVYFYDSCGRYYINEVRERVYKDHDGASEYVLNKSGYLVKVLEKVDGIDYYYDWLGRYRIDEKGHHIYCDEKSSEEYEHDGLGNLVKIHTEDFHYDPCPIQPNYNVTSTEENKYLQREVGTALKQCIASVVLHQPNDPVLNLSESLVKYHDNLKARRERLIHEQERLQLRQYIETAKVNSPAHSDTEDETITDSNFLDYEHKTDEDTDF